MATKCFKMISGEEILADYTEENNQIILDTPVVVVIVGEGRIALVPWLPFAQKPKCVVNAQHVVASYEPNDQLINHYKSQVGGIVTAGPGTLNQLPPHPPNFGR